MGVAPDPADRTLDAAADGAFGGKTTVGTDCNPNRRAGYTDPLGMALAIARKGGTLAAGEGLLIVKYYEAQLAEIAAQRNAQNTDHDTRSDGAN